MNKRSRRQHFVPQFYLRGFSVDGVNLWVYDKHEKTLRFQKIHDTAVVVDFYRHSNNNAPLETKSVTDLEGQVSVIIKKLENKEIPSAQEMGVLLNFITLQFLRTPSSKSRAEDALKEFLAGLKKYYSIGIRKGKSVSKIKDILNSYLREPSQRHKTFQKFIDEKDNETPHDYFVDVIPNLGLSFTKKLVEQNWQFLYTSTMEFITNDDPFVLFGKDVSEKTVKLIPLSKVLSLAIYGNGREVNSKNMRYWAVRQINLGIAEKAQRFIYGCNEKELKEIVKTLAP